MTPELETLLFVASGAALLVSGGAVLRGGAIARLAEKEREARAALEEREQAQSALEKRLDHAERDAAEARERLSVVKDARAQQESTFETKKKALEDQLEILGRQVKSLTTQLETASGSGDKATEAEAQVAKLEGDLRAEQVLAKQMEASLAEVRASLKKAHEETKTAETRAKAAEDKARATSPKPPPVAAGAKPDPKVEAELQATKGQLSTVTQERDQARLKVEALERLVEGVRLRSKELTAELKELKDKHGWGG